MPDTSSLLELAKQLGIAVLLFGALLLFAKIVKHWINSEQERWAAELSIREKKNDADKAMLTSLIEKNYTILHQTMLDSREQILVITRLVERVKTMQESSDTAFRDLFLKYEEHNNRPTCADKMQCR
jgi:hypothetical protein